MLYSGHLSDSNFLFSNKEELALIFFSKTLPGAVLLTSHCLDYALKVGWDNLNEVCSLGLTNVCLPLLPSSSKSKGHWAVCLLFVPPIHSPFFCTSYAHYTLGSVPHSGPVVQIEFSVWCLKYGSLCGLQRLFWSEMTREWSCDSRHPACWLMAICWHN